MNDQAFQYALAALQAGDTRRAEDSFKAVLRAQPKHVGALNLLGITLIQLGRFAEAEGYLRRALQEHGNSDVTLYNYGIVLKALGRPVEALERFTQALAIKPAVAETWNNRGTVLNDLKRFDEAIADFDKAIALRPDSAEAICNKARALCMVKRPDEALTAFKAALAVKPDLAEAWLGCANIHREHGRHDEALSAVDRALRLRPDLAEAWLVRGNVLYGLKRWDEAGAAYDASIGIKANLDEAWLGRAHVHRELKRWDAALAAYDRALALNPKLAEAWHGRGNVFFEIKRHDEAIAAYDQALALLPDSAEAWHGRACALLEANRLAEAFAAFDQALALKPNYSAAISDRIFALDFVGDAGFEQQQEARRAWWREVGAPIAERSRIQHGNSRIADRRIKVGYVSSDFRNHSAAYCFRPMLLNHDRSGFEITCYYSSFQNDEVTEDFRRLADRWRDVPRLSDEELCRLVQDDQIDILVDLSGYTAGHRFGVFARKAAPIQVSGGATGTGIPAIDYLFSDPVACPAAVRHLFAEKVVDLPSIMTIEALPGQVHPSDPPFLAKGHVTFGVFNRATKVSADVVSVWADILDAVPSAHVLFKHYGFDDAAERQRVLDLFTARGIAAQRIAFRGATSREDHLAAFRDVDISLDPFPHNGGISTLESLQVGVPVVAKLGHSITSRAAGAILCSVGMADWVAESIESYVAIAVKFASAADRLKALRHELPTRVASSAAGNSAIYTKAIEAAYRKMWVDYCRAAAPQLSAV